MWDSRISGVDEIRAELSAMTFACSLSLLRKSKLMPVTVGEEPLVPFKGAILIGCGVSEEEILDRTCGFWPYARATFL